LLAFLFSSQINSATASPNELVASGEGFEINEQYIQSVVDLFKIQGFTSKRNEYVHYALRTKLFASEAKASNLEPIDLQIDQELVNESSVDDLDVFENLVNDLSYAEAYAQKLREDYKIPDEVVESYYKSNPNKFESTSEMTDKNRQEIKNILMKNKLKDIYSHAYGKLSNEYKVVVYDE
jgi:hypothetical protein